MRRRGVGRGRNAKAGLSQFDTSAADPLNCCIQRLLFGRLYFPCFFLFLLSLSEYFLPTPKEIQAVKVDLAVLVDDSCLLQEAAGNAQAAGRLHTKGEIGLVVPNGKRKGHMTT